MVAGALGLRMGVGFVGSACLLGSGVVEFPDGWLCVSDGWHIEAAGGYRGFMCEWWLAYSHPAPPAPPSGLAPSAPHSTHSERECVHYVNTSAQPLCDGA